MQTIYQIDAYGFSLGETAQIQDVAPCPGGWVRTPPPEKPPFVYDLPGAKSRLLADLGNRRYTAETSGINLGSVPIATDRETASILTAAYVTAKDDPDYSVKWKAAPGVFVELNAATLIAISTAVRAHVQACFNQENVLSDAIVGAVDQAELEAIDINAGWPS